MVYKRELCFWVGEKLYWNAASKTISAVFQDERCSNRVVTFRCVARSSVAFVTRVKAGGTSFRWCAT